MELKKPKTYDEQLQLIREKGFIISNEDDAINFLKNFNYYRISAYFLPFKKADQTFEHEIAFSQIMKIYEFDSKMRLVLLEAIEAIELYLKTQISYYFAHKYGALGYTDPQNFSDKHEHENFKSKIETCIKNNTNTPIVKHHKEKYNGQFPIWVIIDFFSLGMVSFFYKDLLDDDKKALAKNSFKTKSNYLESWLRCLTDLRNKCAHYSRLYYWSFTALPKLPKKTAQNKLFDQILMLKLLYSYNKVGWNIVILHSISAILEEYTDFIDLAHIGFPDNWENILRWEY